jgi:branched-chain amino acid transport system substrate-binding protein
MAGTRRRAGMSVPSDSTLDRVLTERIDRAKLVRRTIAGGVALGLAPYVATSSAFAGTRTIKIGYVTPRTGPLAGFGTADTFVINQMKQVFGKGLRIGGSTFPVQIVSADTQSNSNRAATVAQGLILDQEVDIILVAGTPDTTNPVADVCEANHVPCLSSVAPWQPYFLGRKGNAAKPFKYTYHFFWGLEDVIGLFRRMWRQVPTNRVVGGLFPNDPDGNAWGDKSVGFPKPLKAAGYTLVDPGRYPNGNDNFTAQISRFKSAGAQVVTGVPIPPDFTTFWTQALQQGFHPRIATVGKALLFPSSVEALGSNGVGLSSEVWWSPSHPFRSSLTRQTAAQLAAAYERATKQQWTQPIGFAHALFEIAARALVRAGDPDDEDKIAAAIKATSMDTIVGHVSWKGGPVPNVAKTKLVGGQWRKGTRHKYDLVIVENQALPKVKRGGRLLPITYS